MTNKSRNSNISNKDIINLLIIVNLQLINLIFKILIQQLYSFTYLLIGDFI